MLGLIDMAREAVFEHPVMVVSDPGIRGGDASSQKSRAYQDLCRESTQSIIGISRIHTGNGLSPYVHIDGIERFATLQLRDLINVGNDVPLLGESEGDRHERERLAAVGTYAEEQYRGGVYRLPGAPAVLSTQAGGGSPIVVTAAARRAAQAAVSRDDDAPRRLHQRGSFVDLHDNEMSPYVPRGGRLPVPPSFDLRSTSPPQGSVAMDEEGASSYDNPRRTISEPLHEDSDSSRTYRHPADGASSFPMGRATINEMPSQARHPQAPYLPSSHSFESFAQGRMGGALDLAFSGPPSSGRPTDNDFTRGSSSSALLEPVGEMSTPTVMGMGARGGFPIGSAFLSGPPPALPPPRRFVDTPSPDMFVPPPAFPGRSRHQDEATHPSNPEGDR